MSESTVLRGPCSCGHAGWVHDTPDGHCFPPQGCECRGYTTPDLERIAALEGALEEIGAWAEEYEVAEILSLVEKVQR
jgi:hypothetical protein